MPRYKPQDRNGLLLPVVLSEQIVPGSFAFALDYLVDHELDLSALDARFRNDAVGASAYDPRVMLKIVLLAYSQGIVSSRAIERACLHNVQFIAVSGHAQPSHAHIAKFVSSLGEQIKPLFTQVLMVCDAQGLIGGELFAIDGVKLPSNASKERSGTHEELRHRAQRLERAADKIVNLHRDHDQDGEQRSLDDRRQRRIEALRREAAHIREFVARVPKRLNRKGGELKTNVTDPDSAKMATGKGVIQGYAAQAAVDQARQVIVAADVTGSGSEQAMLLPMVQACGPLLQPHTLITAEAGYHSDANDEALRSLQVPALIAVTRCVSATNASPGRRGAGPRQTCCMTSSPPVSHHLCGTSGPKTSISMTTSAASARRARRCEAWGASTCWPTGCGARTSRPG